MNKLELLHKIRLTCVWSSRKLQNFTSTITKNHKIGFSWNCHFECNNNFDQEVLPSLPPPLTYVIYHVYMQWSRTSDRVLTMFNFGTWCSWTCVVYHYHFANIFFFRVTVLTADKSYNDTPLIFDPPVYPTTEKVFFLLSYWYGADWYEWWVNYYGTGNRGYSGRRQRPQRAQRCQRKNRIVIGRRFTEVEGGYLSLTMDELTFWNGHVDPGETGWLYYQYSP